MNFLVDTHTHTLASGHAYNTIQEMAKAASDAGLEAFAITDHGPLVQGNNPVSYFINLEIIPEELYGVRVLRGCEVNVVDFEGNIDLEERALRKLDFVIASLHELIISPGTIEENTNAIIKVLRNPFVHAIGHPDNPSFPIDFEMIIKNAKEYNKLIEMNEASFRVRKGGEQNALKIAACAKKNNAKICVGSDAHYSSYIGKFERVSEILAKVDMPQELIVNTSKKNLFEFLKYHSKDL